MHVGRLVFAQVMDLLPLSDFRRCVARYPERRPGHTFSCLDQFLCMAFAQLTTRESIRDIESCLRAVPTMLYPRRGDRLGCRSHVRAAQALGRSRTPRGGITVVSRPSTGRCRHPGQRTACICLANRDLAAQWHLT